MWGILFYSKSCINWIHLNTLICHVSEGKISITSQFYFCGNWYKTIIFKTLLMIHKYCDFVKFASHVFVGQINVVECHKFCTWYCTNVLRILKTLGHPKNIASLICPRTHQTWIKLSQNIGGFSLSKQRWQISLNGRYSICHFFRPYNLNSNITSRIDIDFNYLWQV